MIPLRETDFGGILVFDSVVNRIKLNCIALTLLLSTFGRH